MGFSVKGIEAEFLGGYITVKVASKLSGYNDQYIRRLLRHGNLKTKRIGQIWLIEQIGFMNYLKIAKQSKDNRFGPRKKSTQ